MLALAPRLAAELSHCLPDGQFLAERQVSDRQELPDAPFRIGEKLLYSRTQFVRQQRDEPLPRPLESLENICAARSGSSSLTAAANSSGDPLSSSAATYLLEVR